jgi:hypothetical protein
MRLQSKLEQYEQMVAATLAQYGVAKGSITEGWQAWRVAGKAGVLDDAFAISRDITDGHIQTALEKIFPAAVFKDPKRY